MGTFSETYTDDHGIQRHSRTNEVVDWNYDILRPQPEPCPLRPDDRVLLRTSTQGCASTGTPGTVLRVRHGSFFSATAASPGDWVVWVKFDSGRYAWLRSDRLTQEGHSDVAHPEEGQDVDPSPELDMHPDAVYGREYVSQAQKRKQLEIADTGPSTAEPGDTIARLCGTIHTLERRLEIVRSARDAHRDKLDLIRELFDTLNVLELSADSPVGTFLDIVGEILEID